MSRVVFKQAEALADPFELLQVLLVLVMLKVVKLLFRLGREGEL
jgi:hypothetical protein